MKSLLFALFSLINSQSKSSTTVKCVGDKCKDTVKTSKAQSSSVASTPKPRTSTTTSAAATTSTSGPNQGRLPDTAIGAQPGLSSDDAASYQPEPASVEEKLMAAGMNEKNAVSVAKAMDKSSTTSTSASASKSTSK